MYLCLHLHDMAVDLPDMPAAELYDRMLSWVR
jgi:hypothetical protein